MKFTKMQGCGNDYVYVNGGEYRFSPEEKVTLARKVSDRHFGIGSDGLIFINPSKIADFEMEMYNADGSRSEMCGNGIRCVGKYVYDHGLTDKTEITVESFGKIKYLTLTVEEGKVSFVRVDMGSPILSAEQIPVDPACAKDEGAAENAKKLAESFPMLPEDAVVGASVSAAGMDTRMTCVSMGNPHAVVFVPDTKSLDLEAIGPSFENHPLFPNRINTEFVEVLDRGHVNMRVWERGTGETLACGTGCCATAVACILNGKCDDTVTVNVVGGRIVIEWDRAENKIYMSGPAVTAFEGEIEERELL
ncbi:MAG: diaminopimelate epimerase [Lachnospiraceae bacterium]|nr:diaminopimelate epimerase [Lachnospiraceae bacterium]